MRLSSSSCLGSESCSSVGSSSSSLSRPQLPLPASASLQCSTPSVHHAANARGHPDGAKSVPSQLPASNAANYYVLPLEASGIPPGSVLISPHTGGWYQTRPNELSAILNWVNQLSALDQSQFASEVSVFLMKIHDSCSEVARLK